MPITVQAFLLGACLAALFAGLVVATLHRQLPRVLEDLSGSGPRARFWSTVSCLVILLLGILAGTASDGYAGPRAGEETHVFFGLVSQVRFGLGGILAAVLLVAGLVLRLIRRLENPPFVPSYLRQASPAAPPSAAR